MTTFSLFLFLFFTCRLFIQSLHMEAASMRGKGYPLFGSLEHLIRHTTLHIQQHAIGRPSPSSYFSSAQGRLHGWDATYLNRICRSSGKGGHERGGGAGSSEGHAAVVEEGTREEDAGEIRCRGWVGVDRGSEDRGGRWRGEERRADGTMGDKDFILMSEMERRQQATNGSTQRHLYIPPPPVLRSPVLFHSVAHGDL